MAEIKRVIEIDSGERITLTEPVENLLRELALLALKYSPDLLHAVTIEEAEEVGAIDLTHAELISIGDALGS